MYILTQHLTLLLYINYICLFFQLFELIYHKIIDI